mgnify:CR=1 FL=1
MSAELFWAWPLAWLLLPLPLLVHRFVPARENVRGRALRVPSLGAFESLGATRGGGGRRRWPGVLLLVLAWLALVTAVARPQSFGEPIGTPLGGRDLMLGIDISGSMRERDLYAGSRRATRMEIVRLVARDFVERRGGDRIGLIMFGSAAYVQTPLTGDHETVAHFLDEAEVGLAGRSTAIGDAIGLAVKRLRERPAESRVLILLTDGANSAGVVEPVDAARLAADSGIRIYTIGVGAEARSGTVFGGLLGARRAELDERTLRAVAEVTGGVYFRARDAAELERIYREIDALEPSEAGSEAFRPLVERYPWPLGAALLLSLLWAAWRIAPSVSPRPSPHGGTPRRDGRGARPLAAKAFGEKPRAVADTAASERATDG